ncbi:BIG1-domain-containing protein [Thozetella sp. PMI_491]|nr:BIG1-domain-containing protein [Thozetella sp. PMI_491]
MHISRTATLLAGASVAHAFADTSPFVLFSTAKFASTPPSAEQLQTSNQVIASASKLLSSCPTDRYLLISQPNIHAADIRDASGACNLPSLCAAIKSPTILGRFDVAEVVGQISTKPLADSIKEGCMQAGKVAKIDELELKHFPPIKETAKRAEIASDNDFELGHILRDLSGSYTIILFSDPNEFQAYESDFVEPVHMDLKRQSDDGAGLFAREDVDRNDLPLFEKYVFFTPGVFMGLITLIILVSILGIGLKAISSLEVSYGAFDKEMGPAAQKKP